jgi:DNA-3-methyladenine glycosylase II
MLPRRQAIIQGQHWGNVAVAIEAKNNFGASCRCVPSRSRSFADSHHQMTTSRRNFAEHLLLADRHLARSGALMRRMVRKHGPCGLKPDWRETPYESLVQAVVFQQLHGNAARAILRRFVQLFPGDAFPAPELVADASDEALRGVGLSRQKAAYIRDIARQALAGVVPTKRASIARRSDEEIIERITAVKGVGRWTVEMMLMFTLGRLDVWPVDDYGVRKGYSKAARREPMVTPRELREIGEVWAPYRSVAAWYCWREAEAE